MTTAACLKICFKPNVKLSKQSDELWGLSVLGKKRFVFCLPNKPIETVINSMVEGISENEIDHIFEEKGDLESLIMWEYLLQKIKRKKLLDLKLPLSTDSFIQLRPLSKNWIIKEADLVQDIGYRISQFTQMKPGRNGLLVENPLIDYRLESSDPLLGAVFTFFCRAKFPAEITNESLNTNLENVDKIVQVLAAYGFIEPEKQYQEKAQGSYWKESDLYFHACTRMKFSSQPLGATYRFKNIVAPAPAAKKSMSSIHVELPLPSNDLGLEQAGLLETILNRQSKRRPAKQALQLKELATFLYHTAHFKKIMPHDPMEVVKRNYPSGGAIHELEYYLLVNRCDGLAAGFYHYHSKEHALYDLSIRTGQAEALNNRITQSWGFRYPAPDVAILLSTRLERIAWKYEGIAYRLSMLHTGVAFEMMYLLATALGLSPCAIGGGDSRLFADITGLDPGLETSIGEFALNGSDKIN